MMSKKDFIGLADALRPSYRAGALRKMDAEAVADFLADNNPLFKRERWLDYLAGVCGPNGGASAPVKKARAGLIPHDAQDDAQEAAK